MDSTSDHWAPSPFANEIRCTRCDSDKYILKGQVATANRGFVPNYQCEECRKKFRYGPFTRNKHAESTVVDLLQRVAEGAHFNKIASNLGISKSSVIPIIKKYTQFLLSYEASCTPRIGLNLQLDEMFFHITDVRNKSFVEQLWPTTEFGKNNLASTVGLAQTALWPNQASAKQIQPSPKRYATGKMLEREVHVTNVMSCEEKYYLAAVAGNPQPHSVSSPDDPQRLKEALVRTKRIIEQGEKSFKIRVITTDRQHAYGPAIKSFPMFKHNFGYKEKSPEIVNCVESLNRTVRTCIGRWRLYKTVDSLQTVLEFFRLYYNLVQVHSSIHNTPAETAGCPSLGSSNRERLLNAIGLGYQQCIKGMHARRVYEAQSLNNYFD